MVLHTSTPVNCVSMIFVKCHNTIRQTLGFCTFVDGLREKENIRIQCKLIHWIDSSHIVQYKKQNCGSFGAGIIALKYSSKQTQTCTKTMPQYTSRAISIAISVVSDISKLF